MASSQSHKAPRGTRDITAPEIHIWHRIEQAARDTFAAYQYHELRTPVFEHTNLFIKNIGSTTDIVRKEMYTFPDKKGRSLTLRPEGTAPAARAFIENRIYNEALPWKSYYMGPMFRYERPQAGRYRQFHQVGVECIGAKSPYLDAETIHMLVSFLKKLGYDPPQDALEINSAGCPVCRPGYSSRLREYFSARQGSLCAECVNRLSENVFRILDCKNSSCKETAASAPPVYESLCGPCSSYFDSTLEILRTLGCPYVHIPNLARGLDYYTGPVYELKEKLLGTKDALAGGGRYDNLIHDMGGPSAPACGFAVGIERLVSILTSLSGKDCFANQKTDLFIAHFNNPETTPPAARLTALLRTQGIRTGINYENKSLKAQLRNAQRCGSRYVIVLGEEELRSAKITVKSFETGAETEIALNLNSISEDSKDLATLIEMIAETRLT